MRLLILAITVTSILDSSCTIQKRTFRNGYYISWKSKAIPAKPTEDLHGFQAADSTMKINEKKDEQSEWNEETAVRFSVRDSIFHKDEKPKTRNRLLIKDQNTISQLFPETTRCEKPWVLQKEKEKSEGRKEFNYFALLSFGSSWMVVLFAILVFKFELVIFAVLAAILLAGTIAMMIVAFKIHRDNPGKYKGTYLAVFALVVLTTLLVGGIIYLLGTAW